ncbi:ABC transporter ATP-binding protein [Phytoactinopolyspora halophila]|nr:ABC transporter ATP-binding protein [Phytoactinopolyspora halophila]
MAEHESGGVLKSLVEIKGLTKQFGYVSAIDNVSLDIPEGAFFSLLGPSGCGKTTLLRIIAGLERPTSGDIVLDGKSIRGTAPERRPFNLVFQTYALFPHLTVADNIAFGPRVQRSGRRKRSALVEEVNEALRLVELDGLGDRMPSELSGGQAQRVALARALINRPRLLLLDEPMAALDRHVRLMMREQLLRIHAATGTTFLLVTHDQEEALSMSDSIALMRDGCVEQLADPHTLYQQPSSLFAAQFIGTGSLLPALFKERRGEKVVVEVAGSVISARCADAVAGTHGRLLLRPEEVSLVPPAQGVLVGPVRTSTFLGHRTEVVVGTEIGDVRALSEKVVKPGECVGVSWNETAGVALKDAGA